MVNMMVIIVDFYSGWMQLGTFLLMPTLETALCMAKYKYCVFISTTKCPAYTPPIWVEVPVLPSTRSLKSVVLDGKQNPIKSDNHG